MPADALNDFVQFRVEEWFPTAQCDDARFQFPSSSIR